MARAYSLDLRERVVGAVAAGQSCRSVAKTFMVSVAKQFRLANQRIGFLRFAACADSQGAWHGGKVSGYGER